MFGAQWHGPNFHGMEKETAEIAVLFTLYREIRLVAGAGHFDDPTGLLSIEDKAYHFAQYCLRHTIVLKATDPRDKIYAISSLVHSYAARLGIKALWPKADYTSGVIEVFKITLVILIWKTRSLDLLSYVPDKSERAISTLPTWLPHFHIQNATNMDCLLNLHGSHNYHAGYLSQQHPIRPDVHIETDSWSLRAKGILIDKIEEVTRFEEGQIVGMLKMCLDMPEEYINGEPPVEVLWRTLIAGRTDTAYPAPPQTEAAFSAYVKAILIARVLESARAKDQEATTNILETLESIEDICPHPAIPSVAEFDALVHSAIRDPEQYHKDMQELYARNTYRTGVTPSPSGLNGKSLCRTVNGYLGLFPYSAEVGDEVWLLEGARVFHLLRSRSDVAREFMGESYVHGLMQGEALEMYELDWQFPSIN